MSEINIPERHDYNAITPFRLFVKSNFPFIENTYESLDNYGLYCKVVEYLNQVIGEQNKVNADMITFTDFVTNYFENLDVQEEINNKLDELVENGELQQLLYNIFNELQNEIQSVVSGSPAGTYATYDALVAANPAHNRIYVVTENGHWYYWNNTTSTWVDGGQYQAATFDRTTPAIAEVYETYNNLLFTNEKELLTELSATVERYPRIYTPLKKGEIIEIEIDDSGNILNSNAILNLTQENSSVVSYYPINGKIIYQVKENCEYLRFFIAPANISQDGFVTYKVKRYNFGNGIIDSINKFNNMFFPPFEYKTIDDIEESTGNLYNDLQFTPGGINTNITTLLNILPAASSVASHSEILKVRDDNGNIIKNILFERDAAIQSPTVLFTFDSSYVRNGIYTNDLMPKTLNDLPDVYYVILIKYSVTSTQKATYSTTKTNIYHVGTNQEYTNFTELLEQLKDDESEKTIYLHEGIFDLYQEYGGDDYFNNLPQLPDTAWRNYCKIIPKNTHIIGLGNVVLQFLLPNNLNYNTIFSTLNITDTCTIENIKINQTNGRYLIHIENGTAVKNSKIVIKNVELNGNSYNSLSFGCGINEGSEYNIENINDKTTNGVGFYLHTNTIKGCFLNIKDSIFKNNIYLQNWNGSSGNTKATRVNINNTYLNKLRIYAVDTSDNVSAYSIKSLSTNDYIVETSNINDYNLDKELVIS